MNNSSIDWIVNRLGENSTWRGLIYLITALGVGLNPEQQNAIVTAGLGLVGLIHVLRKEPASLDAK